MSPAGGPPAEPARRRVLVVEDNDDGRHMLATMLALDGHEVHEARHGAEALEVLEAVAPDVVIVDIGLPGVDGYEVARRARASESGRRLALVALTGFSQAEDKRRASEAGFDAHLVKPIDLEALRAVLAACPGG